MARTAAADRTLQPIKNPYFKLGTRDNNVYQYGDVLYSRKSANTKVLQKSTDGGSTWADLFTFANDVGLVVVTADSSILVTQKTDTDLYTDPPGFIMRSTDNGANFSTIKTIDGGGFGVWSYAILGSTILFAGYGKYATGGTGKKVYKTTDNGSTWSTIFTHPLDGGGSATQHIHKVYIDPVTPTTYYLSSGDSAPAKGIWYSTDSGSNWNVITRAHQPTQLLADATYLYFGNDLEGTIQRIAKANFAQGEAAVTTVYNAQTDKRGNFGNLSFYSAEIDPLGTLYFGGVAYGADDTHNNNKDAVLIASADQGATWQILAQYPSQLGTLSTGPAYISAPNGRRQIYVKVSNTSQVYVLDTAYVRNRLTSLNTARSNSTSRGSATGRGVA